MKFLIFAIIIFSFFHFLIGYGVGTSIFASVLLVVLSPFIWAFVAFASMFIWGLIILAIGSLGIGAEKLSGKFRKK